MKRLISKNEKIEQLRELLDQIILNNDNLEQRYDLIISAMNIATELGYDVGIGTDNKNPGVAVVYIELPTGQVSWHMPNENDFWDGHSNMEKFQRIKNFINGV